MDGTLTAAQELTIDTPEVFSLLSAIHNRQTQKQTKAYHQLKAPEENGGHCTF